MDDADAARVWIVSCGSACSPVTATVFKTVGRQVTLSPVCSTRTRFRQLIGPRECVGRSQLPRLGTPGPISQLIGIAASTALHVHWTKSQVNTRWTGWGVRVKRRAIPNAKREGRHPLFHSAHRRPSSLIRWPGRCSKCYVRPIRQFQTLPRDQSPVSMGLSPRLAGAKLTFLVGLGPAHWAAHRLSLVVSYFHGDIVRVFLRGSWSILIYTLACNNQSRAG